MRKQRLLTIMGVAIACAALIRRLRRLRGEEHGREHRLDGHRSVSPESGGESSSQKTLREIVHTSIAAPPHKRRYRMSSERAVAVADVHVGLRSRVHHRLGTDQTATFGGQTFDHDPGRRAGHQRRGRDIGPCALRRRPEHVPAASHRRIDVPRAGHGTNYIASGDVSGNGTLSGAQTTNSYFFLTNLNVQNTAAQGAVVTFGASITDGYASTTDSNERGPTTWPSGWRLRARHRRAHQGISGNRLLVDSSGSSARARLTALTATCFRSRASSG